MGYRGDLWGDLRAMRSNPAGYAATDDARRSFLAALEQSEQLLRSARGLGYATRPLNLFYGLSQAGRAISAAWCPPDQGAHQSWRLSSHGIKARALTGEMEAITVFGDHMSKKLDKDSPRPTFSGVAATLGSDTMTQPTSLLDLRACLPEAIGRPAPEDDGRFGPVQIQQPSFLPQDAETTVGAVVAWTHNWPVDQLRQWERAGWETFNSRIHTAALVGGSVRHELLLHSATSRGRCAPVAVSSHRTVSPAASPRGPARCSSSVPIARPYREGRAYPSICAVEWCYPPCSDGSFWTARIRPDLAPLCVKTRRGVPF